ncbi:MAG: MmcQ/YjbR family DNA-binding protein [Bacteroidetes bacterium]|nr:MmcQ/YjbR family DNA-binding protein [Bacteroidota bacterium]
MTEVQLRQIALTFPEATEEPHFEKTSFRVKKKIFATFDAAHQMACIKLSDIEQDVFSKISKGAIYPVNNKWGKQGWTNIDLKLIQPEILRDALTSAYCEVAPKKLKDLVQVNSK